MIWDSWRKIFFWAIDLSDDTADSNMGGFLQILTLNCIYFVRRFKIEKGKRAFLDRCTQMIKFVKTTLFISNLLAFILFSKANSCKSNDYRIEYKLNPYLNVTRTIFTEFNSFNSLTKCNTINNNLTEYLEFIPKRQCLIDDSFSLKNLAPHQNTNSLIRFVHFINIKGIDVKLKSQFSKSHFKQRHLFIFSSKMNFYFNETLIEESICNSSTFVRDNFFSSFNSATFINVKYPTLFCSHAFSNSSLEQIIFGDITNSFLKMNLLNFSRIYNLNLTLMEKLNQVSMSMNYVYLNENMLSKALFKQMKILRIHGAINGVNDERLFASFPHLGRLILQVNNMVKFLHSGTKWMTHLNENFNSENNARLFILKLVYSREMVSFDSIYEYPNEDLCLFKDFPHERLVVPMIVPGRKLNCTCSLLWLQMYARTYSLIKVKFVFLIFIRSRKSPKSKSIYLLLWVFT